MLTLRLGVGAGVLSTGEMARRAPASSDVQSRGI